MCITDKIYKPKRQMGKDCEQKIHWTENSSSQNTKGKYYWSNWFLMLCYFIMIRLKRLKKLWQYIVFKMAKMSKKESSYTADGNKTGRPT
jgi:hypothetical protein